VEVLRAPERTYGSDAIGGVINIITRQRRPLQFNAPLRAVVRHFNRPFGEWIDSGSAISPMSSTSCRRNSVTRQSPGAGPKAQSGL